jgi:hypothetical protein
MLRHSDRPFKGIDKIAVAAEFVFAAERLIVHDVTPEALPESDRAAVEYYLECLSQKFYGSKAPADIYPLPSGTHGADNHKQQVQEVPTVPDKKHSDVGGY